MTTSAPPTSCLPGTQLSVAYLCMPHADPAAARSSHSPEIIKTMHRFRIGVVNLPWDNFVPPIQGGVFRKYDGLELEDEDCFDDSGYSSEGTSSLTTADELQELNMRQIANNHMLSGEEYIAGEVRKNIEADLAKYPSLDAATQRDIAIKFQALHKRVQNEGFYDCRMSEYAKEMSRYTLLFALFVGFLSQGWYLTSGCFLGLFWQQIMFTAHDAGHRGITHDITTDTLIGIFIGNFCCGLSIGWWKSSHNVHHLVTNSPVSDFQIDCWRALWTLLTWSFRNTILTFRTCLSLLLGMYSLTHY